MRYTKGMRILALAVCAFLLAFTVAAMALEVRHAGHDCLRDQCTVCMVLQHMRGLMRRVLALAALIGALLTLWTLHHALPRSTQVHPHALTPIRLKTRMNP